MSGSLVHVTHVGLRIHTSAPIAFKNCPITRYNILRFFLPLDLSFLFLWQPFPGHLIVCVLSRPHLWGYIKIQKFDHVANSCSVTFRWLRNKFHCPGSSISNHCANPSDILRARYRRIHRVYLYMDPKDTSGSRCGFEGTWHRMLTEQSLSLCCVSSPIRMLNRQVIYLFENTHLPLCHSGSLGIVFTSKRYFASTN